MEALFFLFIFIFGTFIGSFLGVLVDRLPKGESVIFGRSHCNHCRHKLHWLDLIPVFSYLFLGGRCRYCRKELSGYYPVIEISTGSIFVLFTFMLVGSDVSLLLSESRYLLAYLYFLVLSSTLIIIFFTDLRYGIIPFPIVFFAIFSTLLWYILVPTNDDFLFSALWSALGAFLVFLSLFFVTKGRGMGFGDVVYVFLMGFVLGFPKIIVGLYIAFLAGAVVSILLVVTGKKKMRGETIPFGPFLVSGTMISLLWGEQTIAWVMRIFL